MKYSVTGLAFDWLSVSFFQLITDQSEYLVCYLPLQCKTANQLEWRTFSMYIVNTQNHTLLLVKKHENFLILASSF